MARSDAPLLTRRRLLGASGAGALLLGLGGVGMALQPTVMRSPRVPLVVLSPASFSILAAAADRICLGGDGLPTPWELQVPESIDSFLAVSHPGVGAELQQGLAFLENALPAAVLDRRLRPFTACTEAQQDQALQSFATSRIGLRRTIYKGLVGLVTATYWGDPRTFAACGYRPLDFGR